MDNKTTRRSFFRRDDAETTPANRDRSDSRVQSRSRGGYTSNDSRRESSYSQDRPSRSGSGEFRSERRRDDSNGGGLRFSSDSRDRNRGERTFNRDSASGDSRRESSYRQDRPSRSGSSEFRSERRSGSDEFRSDRRRDDSNRGGSRFSNDNRDANRGERSFNRDSASSPFVKKGPGSYRKDDRSNGGQESPFEVKKYGSKPYGSHSERPSRDDNRGDRRNGDARKPFGKDLKQYDPEKFDRSSDSAYNKENAPRKRMAAADGGKKDWGDQGRERSKRYDAEQFDDKEKVSSKSNSEKKSEERQDPNKPVRLNRFIGMSGVCSRREADELILAGEVKVNGVVADQLGMKVVPSADIVEINGQILKGEKKVYIIMNKPKGYVTTVDDPHADRTVIDLLRGKCKERVYPVGRLDKNTTGVLLLTNDGDLTKELTHPSYDKVKIYHVFLDKPATEQDLEQLAKGIELEDGFVKVDDISFVDGNAKEVGVELHSGRNRIVRRMFEHLGYEVVKLDRVHFAGMGKMALRRGFWRYLTPREVSMLKNKSYK